VDWPSDFPELDVVAVDLQSGLEVAEASMRDYARAIVWAAKEARRPLALCGWSLGGLAALIAAEEVEPAALVLLEASAPAEIQGWHEVDLERGVFDPEQVYGSFPAAMRARPESLLARAERKRGISVPTVPSPTLVVSGREFPEERGTELARLYGAEHVAFPELDHWQLVLDPRVRTAVAEWLRER
jgi:pimeloyl-ACP methyl ester carboxylesterase